MATEVERYESGVTYNDRSGAIVTGGTAQSLMAANPGRDHYYIHNPNATGSLWVNELGGTAAVNGAGSVEIVPGQTVTSYARNAVSIVHGATNAKFTCGEA